MEIQVKIHVNADEAKDVTERLVKHNLENKLDNYLKKFTTKDDAEGTIDVKIDKNKKELFDGVVSATLDGEKFRYSREDYKNLDDLVNHLFDHFKEELSAR
ncbi:MAG: type I secretion C-terminal target domain-containing protein [Candidatus Gracilibacteria bacterium]|nr:type I secretion C-terminal target domain-containing protein [Candidatus Gracilibacteria bacterium]